MTTCSSQKNEISHLRDLEIPVRGKITKSVKNIFNEPIQNGE